MTLSNLRPPVSMDGFATEPPSNVLYDQEKLSRYCPGGYHPVSLGDSFKDHRYTVAHKLGWGGFSTVCLAWDSILQEWVALKIATANSGTPSRDLTALRALRGLEHIPRLIDEFIHQGPNGSHQCIVTELLGPSVDFVVADYHQGGDRLDTETILKMTRQILEALVSIHRENYAHGDLSGGNVIFTAAHLRHLSKTQLFDIIGHPEPVTLIRVNGEPLELNKPAQLVSKVKWEDWVDEDDEDIRLIDWGESFSHGCEPKQIAQPGQLKVPEMIFTQSFDHRIDLWRAGCVIYSFVFAALPFQYLGDDDVLIAQMVNFVEALPPEWQRLWDIRKEKNPEMRLAGLLATDAELPKLETRFRDMVDDSELHCLLPVIGGLMRFLPSERISAQEALDLLPSPGQMQDDR